MHVSQQLCMSVCLLQVTLLFPLLGHFSCQFREAKGNNHHKIRVSSVTFELLSRGDLHYHIRTSSLGLVM